MERASLFKLESTCKQGSLTEFHYRVGHCYPDRQNGLEGRKQWLSTDFHRKRCPDLYVQAAVLFFSFLKVPSSQNNKVVPYMDSNFKLSPGGGCISITELLNKGILICSSIDSEPCFQTAELCYQTFVSWTHLSSHSGSVINFVSIELVRYCSMLYKTCVLWE